MRATLLAISVLACGPVDESRPENGGVVLHAPAAAPAGTPVELVVVADEPGWLSALAAPIVARLAAEGVRPAMMVLGSPPDAESVALIRALRPRRTLFVQIGSYSGMRTGLTDLAGDLVRLADDPQTASLNLARRFWPVADMAVAAPTAERASVLLAASLAARVALPVLLVDDPTKLAADLATLAVAELDWVGSRGPPAVQGVRHLTPSDARGRVARLVAPARNVVVVVDPAVDPSPTAWLGPYVAWARRAPLVVSPFGSGELVEAHGLAEMAAAGAAPRTITLLADYDALGTVPLPDAHFGVEPFTLRDGRFAPWAVGRIPFDDRPQASAMFARALAFPERPPQVWSESGVLRPAAAAYVSHRSGAPALVASVTGSGGTRRADLAAELRAATSESAGEAFREARIRFLIEHPEGRLTALAFRLWGDPELGR